MGVSIQQMNENNMVLVRGHLDVSDCHKLEQAMSSFKLTPNKSVWVDCEHLDDVSTEVLRWLLFIAGKAKANKIDLVFYQLNPLLKLKIKDAGLDSVLQIVPTIADAYYHSRHKD